VSEDGSSQAEIELQRSELQEIAAEQISAELEAVEAEKIAQITNEERGEAENAPQEKELQGRETELESVAAEKIAQARNESEMAGRVEMPDRAQPQPAPPRPQLEQGQPRVVASQRAGQSKLRGRCFGGKRVAENNREGMFETFSKMNESVFSLDGVKKAAAWYIETSEKLANQAIELQERATGWAKDTPFAPLFEAQNSFARKFVERSANAARTLWQIQN
jgi:hypothetical protein